MMRLTDERLRPCVGDRPQRRGGLRDREGEVEAGHRPAPAVLGLLGLDLRDRFTLGTGAQFGVEFGDTGLDPLRHGLVGVERVPEGVAGDRVPAHAHHELELGLRYPITHRELTIAEGGDTRAEPLARWRPRLDVVPRQRGRE